MKPRPWVPPLALAGAVAVAYLNALRGAFQFDDYNVIVDNPVVHSWTAFLSDLPRGIRSLLKFTYTLNWTSGLGPFGFHLVNVSLHTANAVLVYLLARRMAAGRRGEAEGRLLAAAPFLAALLFAVHPVQTEAVTYISGRSMSLMAFFYLGSLLAYAHGAATGRRAWTCVASPVLFLLAVLAKETAITLPFALLLWEAGGRAGRLSWREAARHQAVHWTLLLLFLAAVALHPGYKGLLLFGLESRTVHDNLLSQIHGIAYLLSRLAWVHRLCIDPDLPVLSSWSPSLAAEAALLLSLVVLGAAALRKSPRLGFGLLWFFLHLVPTNSVIPRLDVANERHLYLASWGIFLVLGAGVESAQAAWRKGAGWVRAGAFAVAAVLLCFTVIRNGAYRSEVALWEDTAHRSPGKARVHNNLGYAYSLAGRPDKAIRSYREALRLDPDFALATGNFTLAVMDVAENVAGRPRR